MRKFQTVLAHLNLMFGTLFLVLWVINIFNPKMQFLASGVTNVFLVLFCLCAIGLAIVTIVLERRYAAFQRDRAMASARIRRMGQQAQNQRFPQHPQRPK